MRKRCAAGCSPLSALGPGPAVLPQKPRCFRGSAVQAQYCRFRQKTIKTATAIWPLASGCWIYSCDGICGAGIAQHRTFRVNLAQRFCLKYDQELAVCQKILLRVKLAERK